MIRLEGLRPSHIMLSIRMHPDCSTAYSRIYLRKYPFLGGWRPTTKQGTAFLMADLVLREALARPQKASCLAGHRKTISQCATRLLIARRIPIGTRKIFAS